MMGHIRFRRWAALLVLAQVAFSGHDAAAQSDSATLFREDARAYYTAEMHRTSPYQWGITYAVYFKGTADTVTIHRKDEDGEEGVFSHPAARVDRDAGTRAGETVRVCVDEQCDVLRPPRSVNDTADYRVTVSRVRIQVTINSDAVDLSGKEDVYLVLPANYVGVQTTRNGPIEPSPAIHVLLPRLEEGNPMAGGPPLFRMDLSPLARETDANDDAESLTLDFEGGIRRFARLHRTAFTYSGKIAAEEEVSFNSIQAQFEYERNLRPQRYVPLLITGGAESDQDFEIANALVTVQTRGLLPFNVNYSPRDEGYIPNVAPLLTVRLEGGWNLRDQEDEVEPENFMRPGYALRWKVPIARNTVVRLDHDGRWAYSGFFDGAPEFHPMWDAGVEFRRADVTYFIGYRRGEAPPVFREVSTMMAGLVFGVR